MATSNVNPNRRVVVLVADSLGCGDAPDAAEYNSTGANTLGRVLARCAELGLTVPTLTRLGLCSLADAGAGEDEIEARVWALTETSQAVDTPSGHWELTGRATPHAPPTYPNGFTAEFLDRLAAACGVDGFCGNVAINGIAALQRWGEESSRTNRPIVYTSSDSVLQIAANEATFGLQRLYECCETARELSVGEFRVGRVIARPFTSDRSGFERTTNRRDYSEPAPFPTALDLISDPTHQADSEVLACIGVGKIGDIFSERGLTGVHHPGDDRAGMAFTRDLLRDTHQGGLIFTNLVDFDTSYGHMRNVDGYARHLHWFDGAVSALMDDLVPGDRLVITADHGNDPTWVGSDHTRERVPCVVYGVDLAEPGSYGSAPMAALGVAVCEYLQVSTVGLDEATGITLS